MPLNFAGATLEFSGCTVNFSFRATRDFPPSIVLTLSFATALLLCSIPIYSCSVRSKLFKKKKKKESLPLLVLGMREAASLQGSLDCILPLDAYVLVCSPKLLYCQPDKHSSRGVCVKVLKQRMAFCNFLLAAAERRACDIVSESTLTSMHHATCGM